MEDPSHEFQSYFVSDFLQLSRYYLEFPHAFGAPFQPKKTTSTLEAIQATDVSRFAALASASELHTLGFWTRYTRRIAKLIVNYAGAWRLAPVRWNDETDQMRSVLQNASARAWWQVHIFIAIALHCAVLAAYVYRFLTAPRIHFDPNFAFHSDAFCITIFALASHVQTILKIEDLISLYNRTTAYYVQFQCKYAKSFAAMNRVDVLCAAVLYLFFCSLLAVAFVLAPWAYVAKCDIHVFAHALPICEGGVSAVDGGGPSHRSPALVPVWFALQAYYVNITVISFMVYLYFFITTIVFGLQMERELRASDEDGDVSTETLPLLRCPRVWNLNYRIFQLLTTEIDSCLGSIFLPAQAYCIVLSAVLVVYFLVKSTGLIMQVYGITYIFLVSLYFVTILRNGAKVMDESKLLVASRRRAGGHMRGTHARARGGDGGYERRFLRSCRAFKVNLGPFMEMNGETVYMLFSFIPSNTVTMLLL